MILTGHVLVTVGRTPVQRDSPLFPVLKMNTNMVDLEAHLCELTSD